MKMREIFGAMLLVLALLRPTFAAETNAPALLDARAVMKHLKNEQAALFQRALKEIEQDAEAKDGPSEETIPNAPRGSRHLESVQ